MFGELEKNWLWGEECFNIRLFLKNKGVLMVYCISSDLIVMMVIVVFILGNIRNFNKV